MAIVQPFAGIAPRIGRDVYLAESATVIGDATLGDEASVWFNSIVRADVGWIRIGKRTNVQDLTMIHVTGGIANTEIGDEGTSATASSFTVAASRTAASSASARWCSTAR